MQIREIAGPIIVHGYVKEDTRTTILRNHFDYVARIHQDFFSFVLCQLNKVCQEAFIFFN